MMFSIVRFEKVIGEERKRKEEKLFLKNILLNGEIHVPSACISPQN